MNHCRFCTQNTPSPRIWCDSCVAIISLKLSKQVMGLTLKCEVCDDEAGTILKDTEVVLCNPCAQEAAVV